MQRTFFLLLVIFLAATEETHGSSIKERCGKPAGNEPYLYSDDFKQRYSLDELGPAFEENYQSGKRLKGRAYYDPALKSLVLPHESGLVKIGADFIRSVTRHIEISLERRYADYIFFPDMGHSHLHLPVADAARMKAVTPVSKMYEGFFAYKNLKMLYHTAEKLTIKPGERSEGPFPQDPILLWRYFSRNPVGDNGGGENVFVLFNLDDATRYNTVKNVPGHEEYSSGFDINASKDGCFAYEAKGKTFYFDISLESLPCRNCGTE